MNKCNLHLAALPASSYSPFEDNILIVVESSGNNQLLEQLELYEFWKEWKKKKKKKKVQVLKL